MIVENSWYSNKSSKPKNTKIVLGENVKRKTKFKESDKTKQLLSILSKIFNISENGKNNELYLKNNLKNNKPLLGFEIESGSKMPSIQISFSFNFPDTSLSSIKSISIQFNTGNMNNVSVESLKNYMKILELCFKLKSLYNS